ARAPRRARERARVRHRPGGPGVRQRPCRGRRRGTRGRRMSALGGHRVLVTGGSRGIGRATALACARAGASVAFNYSRGEDGAEADETLAALRETGATVHAAQADVADAAAVAALFTEVREALGGAPDVLVNNA